MASLFHFEMLFWIFFFAFPDANLVFEIKTYKVPKRPSSRRRKWI